MAYDFLGLVNDVNKRVNEVQLSTSNFASANGFYGLARDSINSALRNINQLAYEWPFNHVEYTQTLTPGTNRYAYPTDTKTVDFDSFRVKRSSTFNNETSRLKILSYEDYLDRYIDDEYNTTNTSIRTLPRFVFRTPDQNYGLHPIPDQAYELVFEYYRLPVDLQNHSDVPVVPEQFRSVIVDGAMYYVYLFRGNTQDAAVSKELFDAGIKSMRSLYINRYEYIRDTRINGTIGSTNYMRAR